MRAWSDESADLSFYVCLICCVTLSNNTLCYVTHRTVLHCTARYIGSMVGDLHRTLLYGGLFGYPAGETCITLSLVTCAVDVCTCMCIMLCRSLWICRTIFPGSPAGIFSAGISYSWLAGFIFRAGFWILTQTPARQLGKKSCQIHKDQPYKRNNREKKRNIRKNKYVNLALIWVFIHLRNQ